MLTDTEKAALERAASRLEYEALHYRYDRHATADAATLRALIARAGWQPIETAPKDGRCAGQGNGDGRAAIEN